MIVLASATGMSAPQIAELVRTDDSHVRKVIHAFNEKGFASLDPDYRGGRPPKTTPAQRDRIVAVARARPDTQGVALTRWSLPKLRPHLIETGIVEELGEETLRQILRGRGSPTSARARGNGAPTPTSKRKQTACSRSIASPLRTGSSSALTRWGRSS